MCHPVVFCQDNFQHLSRLTLADSSDNNLAQVSVDDVAIVHSIDQPRGFWKLGRVKEVLVRQDGETRGAVVQVAGRGCQATLLHHPIQLLYPLEVSSPCQTCSHLLMIPVTFNKLLPHLTCPAVIETFSKKSWTRVTCLSHCDTQDGLRPQKLEIGSWLRP